MRAAGADVDAVETALSSGGDPIPPDEAAIVEQEAEHDWRAQIREEAAEKLPEPDQLTIGEFHHPDSGAPETERYAAIAQYPKSGTDRRRVLDFIAARGDEGATDEEIALGLNMRHYTAAPRRTELRDGGWVGDSGKRRPTTTGSPAAVWVLSERGREEWRADVL